MRKLFLFLVLLFSMGMVAQVNEMGAIIKRISISNVKKEAAKANNTEINPEPEDGFSCEVNGVYYQGSKKNKVVQVIENPLEDYSGEISIPNFIDYNGEKYEVTAISNFAFYNSQGLRTINLPNSIVTIGKSAFSGCIGLKAFTFPTSIVRIREYAFSRCKGLTELTLPDNLQFVESYAFHDCNRLTTITFGNGLKKCDYFAFGGCISLSGVYINDLTSWCNIQFGNGGNPLEYAHHLFLNGEEIVNLAVPDDVYSINSYAFKGGSGLVSVRIPDLTTTIESEAFGDCKNLKSVYVGYGLNIISKESFEFFYIKDFYCEAIIPPGFDDESNSYSFVSNAVLHVPSISLDSYKNHPIWGRFPQIVALTSDDTSINEGLINDSNSYDSYSVNGMKLAKPHNGVNIIKCKNVTKKIYKKQ